MADGETLDVSPSFPPTSPTAFLMMFRSYASDLCPTLLITSTIALTSLANLLYSLFMVSLPDKLEHTMYTRKQLKWLFNSLILVVCLILTLPLMSQTFVTNSDWAELASFHYGIGADITYGTFNNTAVHLDVWQNLDAKGKSPTLVYIHGGGWVFGDKGGAPNVFLPYVERGWNIVNVEYRMASTALAPAAVEDSRCALRWVYNNAEKYHFDLNRIVLTGHSAGGHLALITGMLPNDSEFDNACPRDVNAPPLKVAAIVNWYGITDVDDLLAGPDRKTYAVEWLGASPNKHEVAKESSPLTYVRVGLPPIITIHGDHDSVVPYSQAVRLQSALNHAGVKNELVTIPGGNHGNYSDDQTLRAFREIWKFLDATLPPEDPALK
jgi:acetyl esterase/lipase